MQNPIRVLDLFSGLTPEQARRLRDRIIPALQQERAAVLRDDPTGAGQAQTGARKNKQRTKQVKQEVTK